MAHEVETMSYAGETPWHGLGVKVPSDLSPEQFMKKAKLDWTVEKIQNYYTWNDKQHKSSDFSLVRSSDGTELTTISGDWEPVQNLEAFRFFQEFVNAGDMEMHTAGSLKNGQIIWALAKIKESFSLFKGDQVDSYLLFSNPHQYGKSIDIRFTPIRVVCNNTLTLSLQGKTDLAVKLNHRKKFNPDMVKQTLGIATSKLSDYKSMAEYLGSKRYTSDNVLQYFKEVFNAPDKVDSDPSRPAKIAAGILESQPGAQYAEGTWWQAANAVTYSIDHLLGRSQETRLQSAWYGVNRAKKIKALELATRYADAA